MVLRAGGRQRVGGDKVYIEYLHVNKLQITLSFLPSPGMCLSVVQTVFLLSYTPSASKLLLICDHQHLILCLSFHGIFLVPRCLQDQELAWTSNRSLLLCALYCSMSSCISGRHHSCYIAGVSRGYQWFISVAGEVEGGYLGLAPLQLHHPLLSRQALVQLVHSHYIRAALPGLINMLGSSNVLGKQ